MAEITFILGGARSGKSAYALKLAKQADSKVAFIATCVAEDPEMKKRVALHKKGRPKDWQTFEVPCEVNGFLKKQGKNFGVIIIDCLTLLVSNLILKGMGQRKIEEDFSLMAKTLKSLPAKTIVVSNEVGLGIVPDNKLSREFRDLAGKINQLIAGASDEVFFIVSGLPLRVK